ncbi:MAG: hypothetical protein ABIJ97_05390 [Bacteroidota bacterium]
MEDNDLKNIAPKLFSAKKENPFIVPENYFENFSSVIQDKIEVSGNNKGWQKIYHFIKPQLKLAAGFILFALFAAIIVYSIGKGKLGENEKISNNEIIIDDELQLYGISDDDQIISVLIEEEYSTTDTLSSEEIVNYLVDSELDYLAYIEEF